MISDTAHEHAEKQISVGDEFTRDGLKFYKVQLFGVEFDVRKHSGDRLADIRNELRRNAEFFFQKLINQGRGERG